VHKLAQSVLAYIRKEELLQAGDRVGIAVSGGADSVALLRIVLELRDEIGIVLSVVHLNHQLRGAESDADEAFVRESAEANGLGFVCERRDVKTLAAKKKVSIETAARELRFEFFREALERSACEKIATAHTLDDQAETVLLKLSRGAGTRGIAGIWPKVGVRHRASGVSKNPLVVRPLLKTPRNALREYLAELGQTWREDSSNRDLRHTRNRIRHGILPRLERSVNPNIRETFAETAEIARAEEEYWAGEVQRLLSQVWEHESLHYEKLKALPLALQRRLVRAAAESLKLNLDFGHVEEILGLGPNASASLPDARTATRCGGSIKFGERASASSDYTYALPVPGNVHVREAAFSLRAELITAATDETELLDCQFAPSELIVRNWRSGERFWACHTKEPRKIKELLQDRHITGEEKKSWPVIAIGDEIVWVRGFGVRRDFRAKNGRGIRIREG
jgi:tRNA(Ile)-lysidine synthase